MITVKVYHCTFPRTISAITRLMVKTCLNAHERIMQDIWHLTMIKKVLDNGEEEQQKVLQFHTVNSKINVMQPE